MKVSFYVHIIIHGILKYINYIEYILFVTEVSHYSTVLEDSGDVIEVEQVKFLFPFINSYFYVTRTLDLR